MKPLAKRVRFLGDVKQCNFDLISKYPTAEELKRWGIPIVEGSNLPDDSIYQTILKYVKKYFEFDVPDGYVEDFKLSDDGFFTVDVIAPERVAMVYMSLMRKESYEDINHYLYDVRVPHKGLYPIIPIYAKDRQNNPRYMSAGCLAFGCNMISARADVLKDLDDCRHAAWSQEYCIELGVKCFALKVASVIRGKRSHLLDAAVVAYHAWKSEYSKDEDKAWTDEYYTDIKALYLKYAPIKEGEKVVNYSEFFGKVSIRGGHAVGDNPLPKEHRHKYPAYNEGSFVHDAAISLCDFTGWLNLEPEVVKLKWSTIAKRAKATGCDSMFALHTNYSEDRNGNLNHGCVTIIYPYENEQYKDEYSNFAEELAHAFGLPRWMVRIRKSTEVKNKNYYGFINNGVKYGIKHPIIIELGYHIDVAGRELERILQLNSCIGRLFNIESEGDPVSTPVQTKYYEVTANSLNVRTGYSIRYQKIDVVRKGDTVIGQGAIRSGWYQITTPSGKVGWVSGKYIKEFKPEPPTPQEPPVIPPNIDVKEVLLAKIEDIKKIVQGL